MALTQEQAKKAALIHVFERATETGASNAPLIQTNSNVDVNAGLNLETLVFGAIIISVLILIVT